MAYYDLAGPTGNSTPKRPSKNDNTSDDNSRENYNNIQSKRTVLFGRFIVRTLAGPTVHQNDRAKTILATIITAKIAIIYNRNVPFFIRPFNPFCRTVGMAKQ